MTWIKLPEKERVISESRWQVHGVAFYPMAPLVSMGKFFYPEGFRPEPEPLDYKRQWENDEDMTLHATISYCVKQCTPLQAPLSAEHTDTKFFASAGHETLQRQKALYI